MTLAAAHSSACQKMPRRRGASARTLRIKQAIADAVSDDPPMTVRQVFYRLVVAGAIDKTEAEYQGTVIRLLTDMRLSGEIDFDHIVDESRRVRLTATYNSVQDALESTARYYRRSALQQAGEHVEIWCEKDALAGVVWDAVAEYDVPLLVSRGMPSLTFLYGTARRIKAAYEADKPTVLYQFGDHDPSGVLIPQTIDRRLRELCAKLGAPPPIVERVALTADQIREHELPTRPTKRAGNSHANGFEGDSVELDALPPGVLRNMVRAVIGQHISDQALKVLRAAEDSERLVLDAFARGDQVVGAFSGMPENATAPTQPANEWDDWDKAWVIFLIWQMDRFGDDEEAAYDITMDAMRWGKTPDEALRRGWVERGLDDGSGLDQWREYWRVHADIPRAELNAWLERLRAARRDKMSAT